MKILANFFHIIGEYILSHCLLKRMYLEEKLEEKLEENEIYLLREVVGGGLSSKDEKLIVDVGITFMSVILILAFIGWENYTRIHQGV